jgi:xanthine dehydrogenase accessory factor
VIPEPRLVVLGAGHVGKALSKVARFSGFKVTVVDDRAEYANSSLLPDADEVIVNDFGDVFTKVPVDRGTYVVIATRGHNHDLDALKAALTTDARYIGLMGSRRKKALIFRALQQEGFSEDDISRVIVPVGLPIGSATPEEIAISIMAQLIQQRRGNGSSGLGSPSCRRLIQQDGPVEATPAHKE